MKLKYVGGGFLAGVPARDLTDEEAEQFGGAKALVASGLYVESKPADKVDKADKTAKKDGE